MRIREWLLLMAMVGGVEGARSADAGVYGRNRYHLVHRLPNARRPFVDRLRPETRQNVLAVGIYHRRGTRPGKYSPWASASLVVRDHERKGSGGVLTNHHASARDLGIGEVTFFDDGGRPRTAVGLRLVHSSFDLDYSLVRVIDLHPGIPVTDPDGTEPSGEIYSAGFDGLDNINDAEEADKQAAEKAAKGNVLGRVLGRLLGKIKPGKQDAPSLAHYDRTKAERAWLGALPPGPHLSIQTAGRVLPFDDGGSGTARAGLVGAGPGEQRLTLAGIVGGSGRPEWSKTSHKMIGIHKNGWPTSSTRAEIDLTTREGAYKASTGIVPMRAILADLARALAEGRIASDDVEMVRDLLKRGGVELPAVLRR